MASAIGLDEKYNNIFAIFHEGNINDPVVRLAFERQQFIQDEYKRISCHISWYMKHSQNDPILIYPRTNSFDFKVAASLLLIEKEYDCKIEIHSSEKKLLLKVCKY